MQMTEYKASMLPCIQTTTIRASSKSYAFIKYYQIDIPTLSTIHHKDNVILLIKTHTCIYTWSGGLSLINPWTHTARKKLMSESSI